MFRSSVLERNVVGPMFSYNSVEKILDERCALKNLSDILQGQFLPKKKEKQETFETSYF